MQDVQDAVERSRPVSMIIMAVVRVVVAVLRRR
jgi:hypothetical protein